jgi:translation elongation factor EF-Tu-like GTPase
MIFSKHEPDIRVTLRFLSIAEGGRKTLAYSDYRPQFFYDNHHYDAVHRYPKEGIAPGEETEAELYFLSPDLHLGKVFVGMPFGIYEGAKKVAEGKILEILALEKNAKKEKFRYSLQSEDKAEPTD